MDYERLELMPGVALNHISSGKFKTACMSVTMLTQLSRQRASVNALVPFVLRRGTVNYPDMEKLSSRLDELYGTAIEPVVRRIGEIHCVGFYASFPEPEFLPDGENLLGEVSGLLSEILLRPAMKTGRLREDYVESEKEKMLDLIRSRVNDKRAYAAIRCVEEMCCCEDFAVSRFGDETGVEDIDAEALTEGYRQLVETAPIEFFYCGQADADTVADEIIRSFKKLPRGEIDYELGTDIRMNALEDHVRYVEEKLNVTQGKLVMGFRMGECMDEPDIPAIYVFNCVFGSGVTSKLFMNVREKLSLCYYASSTVYLHKGLMLVSSGIEFDKYEDVKNEIFTQLESVKNGDISDEELNSAKRGVASDLRAVIDSQGELEGFWLAQVLDGLDYGPEEFADMIKDVTREDVMAVAQSVEPDLIYFLTGGAEEDEEYADA